MDVGFRLVSGGTDNHLMLIDVKSKGLTGKEAEKCWMKPMLRRIRTPFPSRRMKPFVTSGVRIGTPAVTTRGMKEDDMKAIADIFKVVLVDKDQDKAKAMVKELTDRFPLYE